MTAGIMLFEIYSLVKESSWHKGRKIILTIVEFLSILITGCLLTFSSPETMIYFIIVSFAGIIFCSFLNETWISRLLNRPISDALGEISLGIYLGHMLILVHFGWVPKYDVLKYPLISKIIILVAILIYGTFLTFIFNPSFRKNIKKIQETF